MLCSLHIRHIALIDEMTVQFEKGLTALTGETGAGKSILIDAAALLLGLKTGREIIRTGEQRALAEGVFDLSDCPRAKEFLEEKSIFSDGDENELVLSREITLQGRGSCRVNGVTLPLSQYVILTSLLMDLHGQHAHQSLMDDKNHLRFLDEFGDEHHAELLLVVKKQYEQWRQDKKTLETLREKFRVRQDREDILKLQRRELKNAKIKRGEEKELEEERDRFRWSGKIQSALSTAADELYNSNTSAFTSLQNAMNALDKIRDIGENYAAMYERISAAYYEVEDVGMLARQYLDENDLDPARQEEVMARLDLFRRLSRRYGATSEEMLDKLTAIEEELKQLGSLDDDLIQAEDKEKKSRALLEKHCALLTESRKKLSHVFEGAVERELRDLNMSGTRFVVEMKSGDMTVQGKEKVRFLIAPNRGEALQSLSGTASGGELSRLMLAIKAAAARSAPVPSMIFDEIDTGISGKAAQTVAEKMAMIAQGRQVFCVTHLQQIAAKADHQYLVEKLFDGERTVSRVKPLSMEERIGEIARMLGGDASSARVHAQDMLSHGALPPAPLPEG